MRLRVNPGSRDNWFPFANINPYFRIWTGQTWNWRIKLKYTRFDAKEHDVGCSLSVMYASYCILGWETVNYKHIRIYDVNRTHERLYYALKFWLTCIPLLLKCCSRKLDKLSAHKLKKKNQWQVLKIVFIFFLLHLNCAYFSGLFIKSGISHRAQKTISIMGCHAYKTIVLRNNLTRRKILCLCLYGSKKGLQK